MKTPAYVIKLDQGMDDLLFGSTFDHAKSVLGEPTEVESLEKLDEDDLETLLCNYNHLGLTIFFEGEETLVLSSIETDNHAATLFGKKIFEMDENQIIDLMKSHGYSEIDMEMEEWGEKRISFDEVMTDFYFDNGKLVTVNWGVLVEGDIEEDFE